MDDLTQTNVFRDGLKQHLKLLLDAITGCSLMLKGAEDAIAIIKIMTISDHQGQYNKNPPLRKNGMMKLNTNDSIRR